MDSLDRAIVDTLQAGFPVSERPFRDAAGLLGTTEQDLIARIGRLQLEGTLTRFGPLFQIEKMGGAFTLAAMRVQGEQFEATAAILEGMPEVAHNYARDHALNMWFVLATETPEHVKDVVAAIEARTGLQVLTFPKEREYFVGLNLKVRQ